MVPGLPRLSSACPRLDARLQHSLGEAFGAGGLRPVAPDTFRRWHDGGAHDLGGRPHVELPPFALSRLVNLTHSVAARLSLSVSTWLHVYRRVLRAQKGMDAAVSSQPAAPMEARGDLHPPQAERG